MPADELSAHPPGQALAKRERRYDHSLTDLVEVADLGWSRLTGHRGATQRVAREHPDPVLTLQTVVVTGELLTQRASVPTH